MENHNVNMIYVIVCKKKGYRHCLFDFVALLLLPLSSTADKDDYYIYVYIDDALVYMARFVYCEPTGQDLPAWWVRHAIV